MHAHSWELHSYVLYGRVGNLPVRVNDGVDDPTHRIYRVDSAPDGEDDILPTSRLVRGEPGPEQISTGGEVYTLAAGRFHATVVHREAPAATLVLGRSLPGRVDLALGPLHGGGGRTVRQLCDAEQTREAVHGALRRIHAGERA